MKLPLRVLLVLLSVVLVTTGMVVVWYAWQNYQGARAWEKARADLRARGEALDGAAFIPPPISDDANLAFSAPFLHLFSYRTDPATGRRVLDHTDQDAWRRTVTGPLFGVDGSRSTALPPWRAFDTGSRVDLAAWQRYFRAHADFPRAPHPQLPSADVLLALSGSATLLDEVAAAVAARPQLRFPVNWHERSFLTTRFAYYTPLMRWIETLRLRACAELAERQPDAALRDVKTALGLAAAVSGEPVVLGREYDSLDTEMLLQPVWEGCAERRWSAAQLLEIQQDLSGLDLLRASVNRIRGHRAIGLPTLAADLRQPGQMRQLLANRSTAAPPAGVLTALAGFISLFPRGWLDEGVARFAEAQQADCLDPVNVSEHRVDAARLQAGIDAARRLPLLPSTGFSKFYLERLIAQVRDVAGAQAAVDQAIVACALERFYLDHQTYPADLAALVPEDLAHAPTDLMDGAAPALRRHARGALPPLVGRLERS